MYDNNTLKSNPQSTPTLPWSYHLSQILRPASSITLFNHHTSTVSPSSHPTGEIWKHIFSVCVYSDLAGTSPTTWRKNRRFVRIERFGLSGVVLYQIPITREKDKRIRPTFTLDEVFGSEEYDYQDGMSITQLLDSTNAKMVYFPAYACTSFTIGQVMHSFLTNALHTTPHSARDGFFVFLDSTDDPNEPHGDIASSTRLSKQLQLSSSSDLESDQEADILDHSGDSSVDSFGPHTPPRFDSPPIQNLATSKVSEGKQFVMMQ